MVQLEHVKARQCCPIKFNDINDTPKELHQIVLPKTLRRIPLHLAQELGWHAGHDPQDGLSKEFVPSNIPKGVAIVPDDVFYSSAQRAIPESTYGDSWGWQMWIAKHPVNEDVNCAPGESAGVYPIGITTRPAVEVNGDFKPLDRGRSGCNNKGEHGWECYDDPSASVYARYQVEASRTTINATNPRCYHGYSTGTDLSRGSSSGSGSANRRNENAPSHFHQEATVQEASTQLEWRKNDLSRHDPGEGSSRSVAMSWQPLRNPTNFDNEPFIERGKGRALELQEKVVKPFVFRADTKVFVPKECKIEAVMGQVVGNDTLASEQEPAEEKVKCYIRVVEALEAERTGELPPSQAELHSVFAFIEPVTLSNDDIAPESSASGSSSTSQATLSTEKSYSYAQYIQDKVDYVPKDKDFDANKAFLPPSPTKEEIEEAIAEAKAMAELKSMQEKQRFTESLERTIRDLYKENDAKDAEIRKLRRRIAGELENGCLIAAIYDENIALKKERNAIKMKYEALEQERDAIKNKYEALKQERDELNEYYEELLSNNETTRMNTILNKIDIKALRMVARDQEAQINSLKKELGLTSTPSSPPISVGSMGEQSK